MGPECNAFEGIASSGFRAFCVERKPKRSVQAAMIKHAAEARRELLRGALNGSIWVLGAPVRLTKSALRVLTSPIRLVVNEAIAQITRRDTGSNDARSFPDLGVGTPAAKTTVEAPRCEISGGLKTEDKEVCRNDIELAKEQVAQEQAIIDKGIANGSDASDLGATDCWAGIDISSMRSIGGSKEVEVDVALMMAEDDDSQISADESVGGGADLPSAAFHDPQEEEDGTGHHGRPTDVYVPAPEDATDGSDIGCTNSTVFDQLRQASADGNQGSVAIDAAAIQEILQWQRASEAQLMDLEHIVDLQQVPDNAVGAANNSTESQADTLAPILTKITELLAHSQKPKANNTNYVLTKSIGELKLDVLDEAEHGQMHAWEAWLKGTKLKLKQKASGLVELLEPDNFTIEKTGHSQQLCAAFLRCFAEGTRVWDIAQTEIQKNGERADLVIQAIESEVGRGELFRAFAWARDFFEDAWMKHMHPWGSGLGVTLSHLNLLKTRLTKENLTVDQLMVLRIAALLPPEFSWLQREIFKSDQMTMDHLQEALKPHVRAGVLAVDQSHKHRAVGAGAADTKKEAKAMAAITRQNRELTKENDLLKQARPERPKGKGKGSKGGGKGGGKGKSSKGKFKVVCAHPDCSGEHYLKHCPKMKNISTAEFQKQYKQYMDALYATKRSEKGGGYAGVELQACSFEASPDKASAQKVSVPEAEVSVPGAAAEEPDCVSVPWSGSRQ